MNDALIFATKYANTEAATPFIIIFAYAIVFFASALTYFVAKISASFMSRCVDIQAYLLQKQRTSIRKVPLYPKLHHLLIVLRRRVSATPNAKVARLPTFILVFTIPAVEIVHKWSFSTPKGCFLCGEKF